MISTPVLTVGADQIDRRLISDRRRFSVAAKAILPERLIRLQIGQIQTPIIPCVAK